MRAHKSCCVKLLKPGAVFKDTSNAESFQRRGNVCCLPVPKGHTYSTGFEMCRTNWKKEVGFGVLAVRGHMNYSQVRTWHSIG